MAGSDEQRSAWLPRIATGDAIVTPAWLEPGGGFGPDGVTDRGGARRRRLAADRHEAPRGVRGRRHPAAGVRPRRRATSRPFLVDPEAGRRHGHPAALDRRRTRSTGSTSPACRSALATASAAWARLGARPRRRPGPARGPGRRRGDVRPGDHGPVRQGPRAVRQADRRVPGDRPLPRRPSGRARRRPHARPRGGVGRGRRAARSTALAADGEAVRRPGVPRRHRHVAADLRRCRLHRRLRHPALLPPGQAAPDSPGGTTATSKTSSPTTILD